MTYTPPPNNFPAVWSSAWGEDSYGYWQSFEIEGIQQIMRWIPAGAFKIGSPNNEAERSKNREKQHDVLIENGFWLADTACSQALWKVVMRENKSRFDENDQNPVESISYDDCQTFISRANQLLGDNFLRFPREIEWEYGCRADTQSPFNTGETITTDQANFNGYKPYKTKKTTVKKGDFRKRTMPVLSFSPNPWGLFQMHGNVWEWCEDAYEEDYSVGHNNARVLRGGTWRSGALDLRSASRVASTVGCRSDSIGLRVAGGFAPQAGK